MSSQTKQTTTSTSATTAQSFGTLKAFVDAFPKHKKHPAVLRFLKDGTEQLSYVELHNNIQRLAAGLLKSGLAKEQKVIIMASNSPSWIIGCLAVIYSGAIAVPVDSQQSEESLKHIIQDTSATWMLCDKRSNERLDKLFPRRHFHIVRLDDAKESQSQSWQKLLSREKNIELDELSPEDVAIIFYTSGTSGLPKGVPLTHENILMQLESAIVASKILRTTDRLLLPLPLYHVYPLNIGLLASLRMGILVILPYAITGPEIIRALNKGKATVLVGVPRLLRSLYDGIQSRIRENKLVGFAFDGAMAFGKTVDAVTGIKVGRHMFQFVHKKFSPSLRLLTSGGAPLEEDLSRNLRALGWDVAVGYGLTETAPLLCMRMPDNKDQGSVGEPIDGVELRVAKSKDQKNDDGEIEARGKNVFSGYLNLSKETKEAFTADGWFKTGDLGFLKNDCLHVTGRISSTLVMEGGKKLQPEDIEKKYSNDPAIREIGVLQVGHKLVALVLPAVIDKKASANANGSEKNSPNATAQNNENTSSKVESNADASNGADNGKGSDNSSGKNSSGANEQGDDGAHEKHDDKNPDKDKDKTHEKGDDKEVEADPSKAAISKALNSAAAQLPSYMRIIDFAITSKPLARTNLGKIKRQELKERYDQAKAAPNSVEKKQVKELSLDELPEEDRLLLEDPLGEKTWAYLKTRFPNQSLTLDTSPQTDLNIDSFEWMNLALDLQENTGVELSDVSIAKITTLRELLSEIINTKGGGKHAQVSPVEEPAKYLSKEQKRYLKPLNHFESILASLIYNINFSLMHTLFHISTEGIENLGTEPVAIIPNHASYLDIFAICAVLPKKYLQKSQIAGWSGIAFANPFNAFMSRLVRAFPVEAKASLMSSLALGASVLKRKNNLLWFPEGERTLDGNLLRFKPGIGMILEKNQVKAVPVYLKGTREALPPGAFFPRFCKITVIFGQAASPRQLMIAGQGERKSERIANALRDKVAQLIKASGGGDVAPPLVKAETAHGSGLNSTNEVAEKDSKPKTKRTTARRKQKTTTERSSASSGRGSSSPTSSRRSAGGSTNLGGSADGGTQKRRPRKAGATRTKSRISNASKSKPAKTLKVTPTSKELRNSTKIVNRTQTNKDGKPLQAKRSAGSKRKRAS